MQPERIFFHLAEQNRKISYLEWGDDSKFPIICVHGLTRNAQDFIFLAEELSKKYHVLAIDVAGRGLSDSLPNAADYNNFTYAKDIIDLLKSLHIKKCHWIGTSMGGLIGMLVSTLKPGLIDKMVINDIGPFIPSSALRRIAEYTGVHKEFGSKEDAFSYLKEIYVPWGIKNDGQWEHLFNSTFKSENDKFRFSYDMSIGAFYRDEKGNIKEIPDVDLWEMWDKIASQVLLLRGKNSDILMKNTADEMTTRGPKAKLVEFDDMGHAPSLMEDSQIRIISDWIG